MKKKIVKEKEEIDQIIGNLELVQNDLKALLLEEDTKLSIEKADYLNLVHYQQNSEIKKTEEQMIF